MHRQTKAISTPFRRRDAYDALSMPVYYSVAFEFDDAQTMADAFCNRIDAPDYSRVENPTVTHFERRVQAVTGATHVTALNSGMAAISATLLSLGAAGKNIVTSRHLFGNTYDLLNRTLRRFGMETRFVDLTDIAAVSSAIDSNTAAIYMEVITNPQLEVADLDALSAVAHRAGVPLVADSTMVPFTHTNLHEHGVDVEVVSSTKYFSSGATSLGGLVIDYGTTPGLYDSIAYEMLFNIGSYMTPHVAFMQTMGLETVYARYAMEAANTMELAQRLHADKRISRVNYAGLSDNPYHQLAMRLFNGTAGAVLTIDLEDQAACFQFINALQLVHRSTNIFDNRTLAIHPATTIFGNIPPAERAAMDVLDTTVRISVGLENVADLYADISQALDHVKH